MQDLNCDLLLDVASEDLLSELNSLIATIEPLDFLFDAELAQAELEWWLAQIEEDSRIFFESLETMLAGFDLEFLLSIAAEIANCPLTFAEDEKTEPAQKPKP